MTTFLNQLEKELIPKGFTQNGAVTNTTSLNANLDFFALASAMRGREDQDKIDLFMKAFLEDANLSMKNLFFLRDVRGGNGERETFRIITKYLAKNETKFLVKYLPFFSFYGRWDDLIELIVIPEIRNEVVIIIAEQILKDINMENERSLAFKWFPSENASSKKTKTLAKILIKELHLTPRQYRKMLTDGRKRINILETLITQKRYNEIEYDKIPSQSGLKYKTAFFRNDEERYKEFLDSLVKGEKTINTATLYPYQIIGKCLEGSLGKDEISLYDSLWNNLPNYTIGEDAMVVCDTSGSMSSGEPKPLSVAVSLAMYFAEKNKGMFNGYFMTFSRVPQLVKIVGRNIKEKVDMISRSEWDQNTNLEAVFMKILNVGLANKIPKDEMIKKLYIISDMEIDAVRGGRDKTVFAVLKQRFNKNGYDLPSLCFWNVNAMSNNLPVTKDENGTIMVSGCSASIFKNAISNCSPVEFMLSVLNSERYEKLNF